MPEHAAIAGAALGAFWADRGRTELAVAAYRVAIADARSANAAELIADIELAELGAAIEGGGDGGIKGTRDDGSDGNVGPRDPADRLRALAEQFRTAGRAQREATARAYLGRCLLDLGLRGAAIIELGRAQACFAAAADSAGETRIAALLAAAG